MNTLALLNMYREKGVTAAKTPGGVRFFGVRNLTNAQLKALLSIPQSELEAALKWQKA